MSNRCRTAFENEASRSASRSEPRAIPEESSRNCDEETFRDDRSLNGSRSWRGRLAQVALGVLAALWVLPLAAQGEADGATPTAETAVAAAPTVFDLIVSGGPLMYPIFLCSLVVATIAIERWISLRRSRIGGIELVDRVVDELGFDDGFATDTTAAQEVCRESNTTVGRMLRQGLRRLRRGEAEVETTLEEFGARELDLLKRRLRAFSVVATLAPLLGLLGTVFGLIICFGEASEAGTAERAQRLADGIYHALVTTAAGLTVAIPSMLLHHVFQGRVDRVMDELDAAASHFLDRCFDDDSAVTAPRAPLGVEDVPDDDDTERIGRTDLAAGANS